MLNKIVIQSPVIQRTIDLIPRLDGFTQLFEGDEIVFTGNASPLVIASPRRYGFEVTINNGRQSIYNDLRELFNQQFDPSFGAKGYVLVQDYISPDNGEMTEREMTIVDLKQVGSTMRVHGRNLSKGTTIKLLETVRKYY